MHQHSLLQPDNIAGLLLLIAAFMPAIGAAAAIICLLNGLREATTRDYRMAALMIGGGTIRLLCW